MHPADRAYRNQTVRLADLTVISGIQLVNCAIYGCSMRRVGIAGTAEQIAAFRSGLSD